MKLYGKSCPRDENVFLIGEDLHTGTFGQTKGIFDEFGPERVVSTPISESGFTGISIGAAMAGLRPVVEYMTSNFNVCSHGPACKSSW